MTRTLALDLFRFGQSLERDPQSRINAHKNVVYAKFIEEVAHPESQKVCRRDLIFQENADSKQRTKTVLQIVDGLFNHRVLPEEGDAKFAYV
ncbi:unnamed protein product [Rotaria sp. Silwood1]|nr:unnamed protein product [Rotaria sp. Silwood1]